jgi:hypothetical protein
MRDGIRHRAAARIFGGFQRLDIIALLERDMGDVANEVLEALVARHEIGLGIDLDDDAVIAAVRKPHKALGGDTSGFLRGLGETFLAKPIDRGLDLALRFVQGRLAIHHARAGLLAKLLDHGGGNHCHLALALLFNPMMMAPPVRATLKKSCETRVSPNKHRRIATPGIRPAVLAFPSHGRGMESPATIRASPKRRTQASLKLFACSIQCSRSMRPESLSS